MRIKTENKKATDALVRLAGAGIFRDGRWLLKEIDLVLRRGEIITLIGPNGAGKSTAAKLALGLLRPDAGSVQRKAGLTVGYVPQHVALDWALPLTAGRLMRLTAPLRREVVEEALGQAGIAHLAHRRVQSLSGGELQRLLLARAIARKPDLLVLDEPAQGLDFTGEIALYERIAAIAGTGGCGVLLISHDLHIVMAASHHIICLNGHICCQGKPKKVAASPEYHALFGAKALAFYQHHHASAGEMADGAG